MRNLADRIERFLLVKLSVGKDGEILVRRNELADHLACAPSQISYVLNTRFTPDRGFNVESRRGSGGFVRIVKIYSREPGVTAEHSARREYESLLAAFDGDFPLTAGERALLGCLWEVTGRQTASTERHAIVSEALGCLAAVKQRE